MSDENEGSNDDGKLLHCNFCGKSQHEVRKLIAGPSVYVCDEDGRTPLMSLDVDFGIEYIEQLLKNGANPFIKDKYGKTARQHYLYLGSPKLKASILLLKRVEDYLLEEINHA